MIKTLRIGLCCLFIGLASLAGGCSQSVDPSLPVKYEVGGAVAKKNPVTLRSEGKKIIDFYAPIDDTGAIDAAIAKYNETNKEDYIRYHALKSDKKDIYDQFDKSRGADGYDVIMYDISWNADFASKRLITQLGSYIDESGVNLKDYLPNAVEACRYENGMYSMPVYVGLSMLYFRRDIISTAPVTWDGLIEKGFYAKDEKLTKNGFSFPGMLSYDAVYYFMEMLNSYGVRILDENGYPVTDRPRLAAVLEKYKEIYTSYFVPSTINFMTEANAQKLFSKGESLMVLSMPTGWIRANSKDSEVVGRFAAAPIPKENAGSSLNQLLTGSAIAVHSASENKAEAWRFVRYMVDYSAQRILAVNGGYAPSLSEIYDNNDAQSANAHFASSSFRKSLSDAVLQPVTPNYFKYMTVLQDSILEYVSGRAELEKTLDSIESGLKRAAGQY